MTKYVKIKENGEALEHAPRDIPGISNWGLDEANVLAAGFLPLEETPQPRDGKRYVLSYEQRGDKIAEVWTEVPLTRAEIEAKREQLYRSQTDKLSAEYTRKSILGTLSAEEKAELEEQIRIISAQIVADNPYPETVEDESEAEDVVSA